MLFLALAALGIVSKSKMPVELNPKTDIPYAFITTIYTGAGPEEMETLVTKPIEDAVGSVSGLKNITSTSEEGISQVALEFVLGTDLNAALADARSKVDAIRATLPQDCKDPSITKLDFNSEPILILGISSKRSPREMRDLADNTIKDRLNQISGVAAITITGGDVREIQVNVDKSRLEAYGIPISFVAQAIYAANLNMPGGSIKEDRREYSVRAVGEFATVDQIRNLKLSVPGANGSRVLTIQDIADVKDSSADRTQIARVQRQDSIGIQIQKQTDANTVEVADGVKKEIEAMKKDVLPPDVKIAVSSDTSKNVRESIDDVTLSLWLGALLAVVIVFLFLHNIRGTFIVALAIPTSIVSTFIPMMAFGFTMNTMTMLGLSLAVGILVDDSIVVLENIYRHLTHGEDPATAALNGRSEIGLAAVTITMVDVVVFVPIAFMGGIVGQFFRSFGLTVACATLFSLLVSFTLTPMLASRWYKAGEDMETSEGFFKKFDDFYRAGDRLYRRMLAWALHHRWVVVTSGWAILLVILILVAPRLGGEFMPNSDNGTVSISIELPTGSSLKATDQAAKQIENAIAGIPEVESIFTNIGSAAGSAGEVGANLATITVSLHDKESGMERIFRPVYRLLGKKPSRTKSNIIVQKEIQNRIASIPAGLVKVSTQSGMGPGGAMVTIELTGNDLGELDSMSQRIKKVISTVPGIINPDISWKVGKPELRAEIDRIRAADIGLTQTDIASALRTSLTGNTDSKFRSNGNQYDIRVQLREPDRFSITDAGMTVVGTSRDGKPVFLRDVAKLSYDVGPTKIERKNHQKKVAVTADLADGYHLANIQAVVNDKIADIPMGNVRLHWGGISEFMTESFVNMIVALMLSIALVYMLMAALFESLLNPFIIMFSLPMALIGAILALALAGETISIISIIGIIMLVGLVTKNAILLIDYTHTLRERGMSRDEAVLEAGPTRLRPIMMTTLAMIFGMAPTALKLGRGGEFRAPMATAVIGGLIVSTLLTLVMIPTTYVIFDDFTNWWHRKWHRGQERPTLHKKPADEPVGAISELADKD
jgi:HAE1 family hydrophobic/amphiphilic exporter-1